MHTHCASEAVQLHNCAGFVTCRAGVNDAVFIAEFLEPRADNDISLNVHHDDVLFVVESVGGNADADFGNAGNVDCAFNQVGRRDEIGVFSRNVLAHFHELVGFGERICFGNVLVLDAGVVERVNDVFNFDISDDCGHNAFHADHLADHAATHLTCADQTRANDFAFSFALCKFLVHVQHN